MLKIILASFMILAQSVFAAVSNVGFQQTFNKEFEDSSDAKYFKISSIEVRELPLTNLEEKALIQKGGDLGSVIIMVDKLIALGTKIYEIIKKGKPVSQTAFFRPVSVLPNSSDIETDFALMENWSAPKAKKYSVVYKNGYGMSVISFDYMVYFQANGSFEGKGQYLTGINVVANNINVSWGFSFDASSELITVANRGTNDHPVAGATIKVRYKTTSLMSNIDASEVFHIDGRGSISKL